MDQPGSAVHTGGRPPRNLSTWDKSCAQTDRFALFQNGELMNRYHLHVTLIGAACHGDVVVLVKFQDTRPAIPTDSLIIFHHFSNLNTPIQIIILGGHSQQTQIAPRISTKPLQNPKAKNSKRGPESFCHVDVDRHFLLEAKLMFWGGATPCYATSRVTGWAIKSGKKDFRFGLR